MKCPSCNKFAAVDIADSEVDLEFDQERGEIAGQVTYRLSTECCGDEILERVWEVEEDVSPVLDEALKLPPPVEGVDEDPARYANIEIEPSSDTETKKIKGKLTYITTLVIRFVGPLFSRRRQRRI